jgi:hypothetical protein
LKITFQQHNVALERLGQLVKVQLISTAMTLQKTPKDFIEKRTSSEGRKLAHNTFFL